MSKVSVIVPVYNAEKILHRCLDSIIENTYKDLEIICVNDGSKDKSEEIIAGYIERDARIKLVSKANGGISSARNAGMKQATGDYVTFVDSDDWINLNYFQILLDALQETKSDIVMCGFKEATDYSSDRTIYTNDTIHSETYHISIDMLMHDNKYRTYKVYVCGCLYRRKEMLNHFPEGIKVIEDNIYNMISLPYYKDVTIVNLPLYCYYKNPNSIMHTYTIKDAFSGLFWLADYVKNEKPNYSIKKEIVDFTYKRALFYRYAFSELGEKEEANDITKRCLKLFKNDMDVIGAKQRLLYSICFKFPMMYRIMKIVKDGKAIDNTALFANAENKLIK